MCDICLRTTCPSTCPNSDDLDIAHWCICGEEIYEGDDCYNVAGEIYCEKCVQSTIAELED